MQHEIQWINSCMPANKFLINGVNIDLNLVVKVISSIPLDAFE